jgi:hypothetical protein
MTTSVSKTTPQSAPRDAQGLMKIGIFQLRILIEACGGLQQPEEKMAFAKMSVEEKVALAQQLLAQWDRANPGGGGAPMNGGGHAMQAPPPMQMMPPPQGMPVTQVDPAAVAAAAQAAAPPAVTTRKPSNKGATAGTAPPAGDLGVDVLNLLNRLVAQNDEQSSILSSAMKEITGQLGESNKVNAENAANYKAVYGALGVMNQQLQAIQYQCKLAMALSLQLAEQVIQGATREQVLGAAMGDIDTISQILAQATNPGKG